MNQNFTTSEYILAQLKRTLVLAIAKQRAAQYAFREDHKYGSSELETREKAFISVLEKLNSIEADAVLGEITMTDEQYASIGEEEIE